MYYNFIVENKVGEVYTIRYSRNDYKADLDGIFKIDLINKSTFLVEKSKTEAGGNGYLKLSTTLILNPEKLQIPLGKRSGVAYG